MLSKITFGLGLCFIGYAIFQGVQMGILYYKERQRLKGE